MVHSIDILTFCITIYSYLPFHKVRVQISILKLRYTFPQCKFLMYFLKF